MPAVNQDTGTTVDEIASGIFRISTPMAPSEEFPPGFTFNQFLIRDEKPLLYHTGPKQMFPATSAAIATVLKPETLRFIAFSHFEADECGALNDFLKIAPEAEPLCSLVGAMTSIGDIAARPPRGLKDEETVNLGKHSVTWVEAPHLPHGWDCGHLFETTTKTLFCGDLFTQFGHDHPPVTEADILEPSEEARAAMDYYAHSPKTRELLKKLATLNPTLLACMHGASWRGNGGGLLKELEKRLIRA